MRMYRKIDDDGYFVEDIIVSHNRELDPKYYVTSHQPEGLAKPRWDGEKWVEGADAEFIESLREVPEPSLEERIAALEKQLQGAP